MLLSARPALAPRVRLSRAGRRTRCAVAVGLVPPATAVAVVVDRRRPLQPPSYSPCSVVSVAKVPPPPPPGAVESATAKVAGVWKSGVASVAGAVKGSALEQPFSQACAASASGAKAAMVQAVIFDKWVLGLAAAQGRKVSLPAGTSPSGILAAAFILLILFHLIYKKRRPRVKSDYVTYRF